MYFLNQIDQFPNLVYNSEVMDGLYSSLLVQKQAVRGAKWLNTKLIPVKKDPKPQLNIQSAKCKWIAPLDCCASS